MAVGDIKPVEIEKIPENFRWRLEDIYESDEKVEQDFNRLYELSVSLRKYSGRLTESAEVINECFKLRDKIYCILDMLYVYCHLCRDDDNSNIRYHELVGRVEAAASYVDGVSSFIIPEILTIDDQVLSKLYSEKTGLEVYRHYIEDIKRTKEHILSEEVESVISSAGDILSSENIYRVLCNVDISFPEVKDVGGVSVELSEGVYNLLIRSGDRKIRKRAFTALYSTYYRYSNTFAALLDSNVKKNVFYSKIRKYNSSFESALFDDNIPFCVYKNIENVVNDNIRLNHKFVFLKKKLSGIDSMHMYDLYAPIADCPLINIPYEESVHIVEKALEPLGKDYLDILSCGFNSRWIDVFSRRNKSSGAYSWGVYDIHPFILLNYSGSIDDISTIAHEMGHSIHSYLTMKNQPYVYSHYSLFIAEVVSAVNEILLFNHLLNTCSDKKARILIVNQLLEKISTTVFRQIMLTEFEYAIYQNCENGGTLTSKYLCSLWHELSMKYYGPGITADDEADIEWVRISHFYWNFYSYKYAAGFAAAMCIARNIIERGAAAVKGYIELLKSGDSDYPVNLLKKAGVDITTSKPIMDTVYMFEKMLNEIWM